MTKIIVLDDDHTFRKNLCRALSVRGYEVYPAQSGQEAMKMVSANPFDAAIIDMKMPGMDGFEVLKGIKEIRPSIMAIILTGYGSIADAVTAIKLGGYHYLTKPCDMSEIEEVLRYAAPEKKMEAAADEFIYQGIVGGSPGIKEVVNFIQMVKDSPLPVLICGESGTGKELVARALHFDSVRKGNPFIAVNCASLKQELLENELFGHVKGAFTGATEAKGGLIKAADNGTLFIDEVGDMSHAVQASLLRFIETGQYRPLGSSKEMSVRIRIIAAINKNIEEEVASMRFRHDLYYRINVCRINVPPLRERREDVPVVAGYFVSRLSQTLGRPITLSRGVVERLLVHDWPGNVRELFYLLHRVVILNKDPVITKGQIEAAMQASGLKEVAAWRSSGDSLEDIEKRSISTSLEAHGWNISRAARSLGIDRRTLQRKLSRYRIRRTSDGR